MKESDIQPPVIPRKLWILWFQGMDEAPFIVKRCVDSWYRLNPDWEIVLLDETNLSVYVDDDYKHAKLVRAGKAKQANLIRLQLLAQYGGVWTDATSFCRKPLSNWIDGVSGDGFFAFTNIAADRLMSNWFLAAKKASPLVIALRKLYFHFFVTNNFPAIPKKNVRRYIRRMSSRLINRRTTYTKYWFNPLFTKVLRIYPYCIFHYCFERVVAKDPVSAGIWESTTSVSSIGSRRVNKLGWFSELTPHKKEVLDSDDFPVYKLSWKKKFHRYSKSTTLGYLLEGPDSQSGKATASPELGNE